MPQRLHQDLSLPLLTTIAFILLLLVAILPTYPASTETSVPYRKPITGMVFTAILILGMTAVFFPRKCSQVFAEGVEGKSHVKPDNAPETKEATTLVGVTLVHGHHPSCEPFHHHEFHVGGRTFCCACTGLFVGAVTALVGTILFFFNGLQLQPTPLSVWVGTLGVALGLLQLLCVDIRYRPLRLVLNSCFVLSAFLTLVGVDVLLTSLTADFFAISLSMFWLFTRIRLSRWRHTKICQGCGSKCGIYA